MLNNFSSALAGIDDLYQPQEDLEATIVALSLKVVMYSAIAIFFLVLMAWAFNNRIPKLKLPLFIGIAGTMALSTLMLIGSTVYLNVNSESGGPVHWHADIEVWGCGNELELRDPIGLSNKIGTSVLHEHDDHRIHLEGVVVEKDVDATLGKFMHVIGGTITDEAMVVPLNPDSNLYFEDETDGDGPAASNKDAIINDYIVPGDELGNYARFINGQTCNEQDAEVQVFAYTFDEKTDTYEQKKLDRPQDYIISDNPNVPPGDCIIFEFDRPKSKTDKLCAQYGVRDIDRCEDFGVLPEERAVCTIKQANYDSSADYYEKAPEELIQETVEMMEAVPAPDPATEVIIDPMTTQGGVQ